MPITPDQAGQVCERLRPTLGYLTRLQRRMRETQNAEGELYRQVVEAQRAMQDLVVMLHYESCGNGVGRANAKVLDTIQRRH